MRRGRAGRASGGHVTIDIARIVGPHGCAIGVDFDADILELARADALDAGLENAEFIHADASSATTDTFDALHARFLLSHVSDPGPVLREITERVEVSWWACR